MKKIITYGTFDLLHVGHVRLLERAKALGDYLVVGLSTDAFNEMKHKSSFLPFEQRKEILEAIKYVDLVIPESNWEQKVDDIQRYGIDTFVIGDDWQGEFDFLNEYCEVVYLGRTKDLSTSSIKQQLL